MPNKKTVTWAVYLMTVPKRVEKIRAVCEQSEWEAMELARPGYHELIRGGIATEVEAETLARTPSTVPSAFTKDGPPIGGPR